MATPVGFEGTKGLAEKIQPLVRFPILMRLVLPGALAAAVVYPVKPPKSEYIQGAFAFLGAWRNPLVVLGAILVLGALISTLGDKIYEIYEGRILWPQFLFDRLLAWQRSRVKALFDSAKKAQKGSLREAELWFRLRMYPLDENGNPTASRPTQLGNILAGYEEYPKTRYGMDSIFYWPRLWLEMDPEKKAWVDGMWSLADGLLYLSAIGFCGGLFWLGVGALTGAGRITAYPPLDGATQRLLAGLVLLTLGFGIYRVSLPFHRRNGETFKAIFDLYRDKIQAITRLGPAEVTTWRATWSYLQYLRVYCGNCRKYFPAGRDRCEFCSYPTARSLEDIRRADTCPTEQGNSKPLSP